MNSGKVKETLTVHLHMAITTQANVSLGQLCHLKVEQQLPGAASCEALPITQRTAIVITMSCLWRVKVEAVLTHTLEPVVMNMSYKYELHPMLTKQQSFVDCEAFVGSEEHASKFSVSSLLPLTCQSVPVPLLTLHPGSHSQQGPYGLETVLVTPPYRFILQPIQS